VYRRVGTLVVALAACLGFTSAAPAQSFSYETGLEGWVAKTDQNTGTPECGKHDSTVARTDKMALDGRYSVGFGAHGQRDCGLLWIEREFEVGTAPVTVDLEFWLWTPDRGDVGTGGTNHVLAFVKPDCVKDPRLSRIRGWWEFTDLGSTGHRTAPGWFPYKHSVRVQSGSGKVCVGQALMIASTYPFIKDYYLDRTTVTVR
jgi:hypothetical protein